MKAMVTSMMAAGLMALPLTAVAQDARPISLDEAVRLARRNAPAAVQARNALRTGAAQVRSRYAAFLPSLNFSAGVSRQDGSRFVPDFNQVVSTDQPWRGSHRFNSSLEIFDGGRRQAHHVGIEDQQECRDVRPVQVETEVADAVADFLPEARSAVGCRRAGGLRGVAASLVAAHVHSRCWVVAPQPRHRLGRRHGGQACDDPRSEASAQRYRNGCESRCATETRCGECRTGALRRPFFRRNGTASISSGSGPACTGLRPPRPGSRPGPG